MSTIEQVVEKVRELPEFQAAAVLSFIRELSQSPTLSAAELLRLPPAERRRLLSNQARQAEALYRQAPDLVAEDAEGPWDHE